MNKKETPAAGRDAQLDPAAHPERPLVHGDSMLQYVAGFAYAESHPRNTALRGGRVGPTDKPQPTPAFSGKYLALRATGATGRPSQPQSGSCRTMDGSW